MTGFEGEELFESGERNSCGVEQQPLSKENPVYASKTTKDDLNSQEELIVQCKALPACLE